MDVKLNGVAFPFKGKFDGLDSMEFADYYLNIDDAITDDDDLRKLNFEALIDELAPQLKNKVIIKKGELYIKSGKYSASIDIKEGTLTIQVTFKNETMCGYFHEGPEKPYPDETPEQFKKRRGELPTPNLPNESEDVAESSEPVSKKRRGIGNVIIEFSVPTEQGMKSIQKIMGPDELETWMNEVGVEDKIQNVFLKLASDDETSLELKPIVVKIRHN